MTTEETIKALRLMENVESIVVTYEPGETRSNTTVRELKEACCVAITALRAQQPRPLDRNRWEGCDTCNNTPGIMFGVITMSIGKRFLSTDEHELKYCPECGRPLTEEAWAELEKRIGGNDGTTDFF